MGERIKDGDERIGGVCERIWGGDERFGTDAERIGGSTARIRAKIKISYDTGYSAS